MIVLDDGWFGKRANDTCSLGDWVADLSKFPHGIKVCIPFYELFVESRQVHVCENVSRWHLVSFFDYIFTFKFALLLVCRVWRRK